jgi:exopolysaccharide biosynthesis polyprenyl glycosylphosphotransferase
VVAVSVFIVTLLVDHHSEPRRILAALVLSGLWFASLHAGFAASRTTLAALGSRVAVLRGVLIGIVLTAAAGTWLPIVSLGLVATLTLAVVVLVVTAGWELLARHLISPQRILLIGPSEPCVGLIREFRRAGNARFTVVGIVADDEPEDGFVLGSTDDLPLVLATTRPDLVALVPGCDRPAAFAQLIDSAACEFNVVELAQLYEHVFGRVPVPELTRAWFMSVLHLYRRPYSLLAKRAVDLLGSVVIVLCCLPLLPFLALAIWRNGRPVLLRQNRVGEHGEIFTMYKLRTMRVDAEAGGAMWAARDDPRVTAAGRLLRRFRLDELPQIWNIVKGDMSLVGPRPERPEFIDELLEVVPFWERRHLVKPGITGWAQVNRGYTADTEGSLEKLSYDLWYIRHCSLTVDLVICWRTLGAVVHGEWSQNDRTQPRFDPFSLLQSEQS